MTQKSISNEVSPIHPGVILKSEFLIPLNIPVKVAAAAMHLTPARLYEIISGKRSVTADSALRLAAAFGTTPQFWLNLQNNHDLKVSSEKKAQIYEQITCLIPSKKPS